MSLKKAFLQIISALTIIASLILVLDITIFDIPEIANNQINTSNRLQFWICIYFLFDLVVLFFLSKNKLKFIKHYGILIFVSIPYINIFTHYDLSMSQQVFYLLKFFPIIRGVIALSVLAQLLTHNKITGLFISYLVLFFSIAYVQTLIFYLFELNINPQVKSYGDVLWWASMTATTLGSNIIPVTTAGKICTFILAITGITIFPIFTVYITTMVQNASRKDELMQKRTLFDKITHHSSDQSQDQQLSTKSDNQTV